LLIIFDLDDTLIDTTGCITPIKLENALQRMVEKGLALQDFSAALEQLLRIDRAAESARKALSEFVEINQVPQEFLEIGVKEIYENFSSEIPVFAREGAVELLKELKVVHQLALVTVGKPLQQLEKMKKAGIDSGIFCKIIVCEEPNKRPHYETLMQELGFLPSEVIVCGDRITTDLTPAKQLGIKTVQVRWGRGLSSNGPQSDVDYTITELLEIRDIVSSLMSFSFF
jgi:FMN phosphatase YigB (HAD superfamily)